MGKPLGRPETDSADADAGSAGRSSYIRIALLFLAGFVVLRLWNPLPAEVLRDGGIGIVQGFMLQPEAGPRVWVVNVDDATIARYGKWPLPRDILGRLVDRIADGNPKAIGLSFVFAEPVAATAPGAPSPDERLADSIRRRPVVLGIAASRSASETATAYAPKPTVILDDDGLLDAMPRVAGLTPLIDRLADAGSGIGILSVQLSHGGVPRRLPTLVRYGNAPLPSLPLEMLRVGAGSGEISVRGYRFGIASVTTGGRTIATDHNGIVWFPTKARSRISHLSAVDLLEGRQDPSVLAGGYVLIGSTASGLSSDYVSAGGELLPGLDALSLSLASLLDGTSLVYPVASVFGELLLAFALIAVSFVAAPRLNPGGFLAVAAVSLACLWGGALWLAWATKQIVDPGLISVVLVATYFCLFLYKYRLSRLTAALTISAKDGEIRTLRRRSAQASVMGGNARLSATLSHELRQPLAAVRNYLGAITRLAARATGSAPAAGGPDLVGYAEEAKRQITSMSDIMREIDHVMQQEVTQSREEDFDHIVRDAVKSAIEANPDLADGVRVVETIPDDAPPVVVNTPQIEQVIRNLVKNALEAPRTGSPLEIGVSISSDRDVVEVAIRDNAAGIPDEQRELVFTPYVSSKPGGTGIGLALCRDIVEAHGGNLWFESKPGKGTVFHFTVPRAERG